MILIYIISVTICRDPNEDTKTKSELDTHPHE